MGGGRGIMDPVVGANNIGGVWYVPHEACLNCASLNVTVAPAHVSPAQSVAYEVAINLVPPGSLAAVHASAIRRLLHEVRGVAEEPEPKTLFILFTLAMSHELKPSPANLDALSNVYSSSSTLATFH